jgi:hypothetical protein
MKRLVGSSFTFQRLTTTERLPAKRKALVRPMMSSPRDIFPPASRTPIDTVGSVKHDLPELGVDPVISPPNTREKVSPDPTLAFNIPFVIHHEVKTRLELVCPPGFEQELQAIQEKALYLSVPRSAFSTIASVLAFHSLGRFTTKKAGVYNLARKSKSIPVTISGRSSAALCPTPSRSTFLRRFGRLFSSCS